MNIFKRKTEKNEVLEGETSSQDEKDLEQPSLGDEENGIEKTTAEDAEAMDNPPSVNLAGREAGNAKTFKLMAGVLVGILIMLVGIVVAVGKYQKSKEDDKAKEAEKIAQQQKNMASGTKIDIEAEKAAMYDVPPPAGAISSTSSTGTTTVETEPEDPIQPIVQPKQVATPQYNDYNGGSMIAGRDYIPPAPVQQPVQVPPKISSYDDPEEKSVPVIAQSQTQPTEIVKEAPSSVLVDVYGSKAVSTTPAKETGLATSMKSSQLANGSVEKRSNTDMLLIRGTTIPCVLKTKINSEYQGFATCQITKDVYSANGKVLLMERGSTVFGEQNVQMTQGKARISILWAKVETPKGVSVSLDSPATGQLGEMGIEAKVNNHFWKRFSGAIMLSVIQDASAIARSRLEKQNENGDTTNITNTSGTLEGMAEEVLKNTINIPPTAIVNQGAVINIMVARDVDFSSIYKVARR